MPIVTASNLVRSFGPRRVLDGVSLSIHGNERVGIVGANGSGKSTLGKMLAGTEAPDAGEVRCRRDARILYLEQAPTLVADRSARDVALSGMQAWCAAKDRYDAAGRALSSATQGDLAKWTEAQAVAAEELERLGGWDLVHRADAILGHLGITDPERLCGTLSGGEQRRVALARLLIAEPDLAILDEPTNHLDIATVAWLERHLLEEFAGAVVLITHDRYLLDRVAQRTVEIEGGHVFSYDGGYESYLAARAERRAHEQRTERNRQNYLRTELEWLRRQPKARTGKSRARIQRIEEATAVQVRREQAVADIRGSEERSGKTILEVESLALEIGGRRLVDDFELYLTQGERIGVVGANGCGKTTLLRCLIGEIEPVQGRVVRGANTRIVYLDQARAALDDEQTVYENVIGDLASVRVGNRELTPRSYLESFLFDDAAQRTVVGTLSGGERARVAIAALLAAPANLVILDEPTNDLDIPTLAALEKFLLDFGGVSIVVTHDRYFLDRVATSLLTFEGGALSRRHESCSQWLARSPEPAREPTVGRGNGAERSDPPRTEKLSYKEERELTGLPDAIETAEGEIARLEAELANPDLYAERGGEVGAMVERLDSLQAELGRLMERWEALETKRESSRRR